MRFIPGRGAFMNGRPAVQAQVFLPHPDIQKLLLFIVFCPPVMVQFKLSDAIPFPAAGIAADEPFTAVSRLICRLQAATAGTSGEQ